MMELRERVARLLTHEQTTIAYHASAVTLHDGERPDLVALDRRALSNGSVDIRRVRCRWPTVQIVMVAAHDITDIIGLIDAGADDAVTITDPALASRLYAAARRVRTLKANVRAKVADVQYEASSGRVWCAGREVSLSPTERSLFECLFSAAHTVITVQDIAEWIWGGAINNERQAVIRVYVGYLRAKLRRSRTARIHTTHGVGYSLICASRHEGKADKHQDREADTS